MTSVPPSPQQQLPPPQVPPSAGGPAATADGFSWRRFALLSGIILLLGAGAALMSWEFEQQLGIRATIVGVLAAILPVPLLVGCFLWLGRYNPKPVRYLVFCFGWGACVATAVSLYVNGLGAYLYSLVDWPWPEDGPMGWAEVFTATTVAPVIEEVMKLLGPLLIFWFRRRYFTGLLDAFVFCGLSAVGFAMVENILYLGRGYAQGMEGLGPAGGALIATLTFIARIVFSGFAHPLFGAMAAIGLGLSRRSRGAGRWLLPVVMLFAAMLLHGLWNLLATLGADVYFAAYLSVMVPIFVTVVGTGLWVRSGEARLAVRRLWHYVDTGWISPPEIAALATYRRRSSARRWAKRVAGEPGSKAMRDYQHLATQLAVLRDAIDRGRYEPDDAVREQGLLVSIAQRREIFAGADLAMPRAIWDGRYYQVQFPDGSVRQVNPPAQPVMPIPVEAPPPPPPAMQYPGY